MNACMYMKVFIHPANLYLLVGTFNPFTFNIIIDMYDLISVFLIVLGLFCVGIFHVLCFLPRKVPLAFAISSVHLLSNVRLFATPWILSKPGLPVHHPLPEFTQNSCPSSRWCHPAIWSSVIPFSSCPQSLPASMSFPVSQLFAWGHQSTWVSTAATVLPINTQDWSPLGWTGWISLQSKGLARVFSNSTVQRHQFFGAKLSSQSNSHIHTWPLQKP